MIKKKNAKKTIKIYAIEIVENDKKKNKTFVTNFSSYYKQLRFMLKKFMFLI